MRIFVGVAFAVGAMLFFSVLHIDQHAGEISYLRGLKRGMDK